MRTAPAKRARRRKSAGTPDYQLPLPLFEHGMQAAHQHPLVGDRNKHIQGRRPAAEAWRDWHYIEGNPPHAYAVMIFDIDDPDRWEYEVKGPVPNWQVRKSARTTTYHVTFTLAVPVARHAAANPLAIRFFHDVRRGIAHKIGADTHYNGLLTKNPLNPPPDCVTDWFRPQPYDLEELREWLDDKIIKPADPTGIGRNEDLFRHCVKLAHQPHWAEIIATEGHRGQWLNHVNLQNIAQFAEDPLPFSECLSIAKSCARYSLQQYSKHTFSEIQSHRADKRWTHPTPAWFDHKKRRSIISTMIMLDHTRQNIAHYFNVSKRTIQREIAEMELQDKN